MFGANPQVCELATLFSLRSWTRASIFCYPSNRGFLLVIAFPEERKKTEINPPKAASGAIPAAQAA